MGLNFWRVITAQGLCRGWAELRRSPCMCKLPSCDMLDMLRLETDWWTDFETNCKKLQITMILIIFEAKKLKWIWWCCKDEWTSTLHNFVFDNLIECHVSNVIPIAKVSIACGYPFNRETVSNVSPKHIDWSDYPFNTRSCFKCGSSHRWLGNPFNTDGTDQRSASFIIINIDKCTSYRELLTSWSAADPGHETDWLWTLINLEKNNIDRGEDSSDV